MNHLYLAELSKETIEHLEDFQLAQLGHSPQLKESWLF